LNLTKPRENGHCHEVVQLEDNLLYLKQLGSGPGSRRAERSSGRSGLHQPI